MLNTEFAESTEDTEKSDWRGEVQSSKLKVEKNMLWWQETRHCLAGEL
jgi:hypothetical protein